jgi:hypothetical protein
MPAAAVANRPSGVLQMQGIEVPSGVVDFKGFMAGTRRHTQTEGGSKAYTSANPQASDVFELRKSDILAGANIRFVGTIVITTATGTCSSTARWPYDFLKAVTFTANNASNVINASGAKLKLRRMMKFPELTDRGVSNSIGGTTRTQGTLALATESWGVGQNQASIAAGTYNVDLRWPLDVAEDMVNLAGAIFLATSAADLTVNLSYEAISNLFVLTGTSTVVLAGTFTLETDKFSIPMSGSTMVLPNLNLFHSIQQSRTSAIANAESEIRVVGQGAGKQLLRAYGQVWNGSAPQTQLVVNDTNYAYVTWRYSTNEQPDTWGGQLIRERNEEDYNSDIGLQGFWSIDFASVAAFRDTVDMGTTGELRLVISIPSGVSLTSPALEYVTETLYLAGAAA